MQAQVTPVAENVAANRHGASTVIENVAGLRTHLTPPDYVDESKINLTDNSRKVLERRYLRRDLDGSFLGNPRRACSIASPITSPRSKTSMATTQRAPLKPSIDLLAQYRFFPNSPTFTGAGTPLGQLAACFVLPIEDDMGKSATASLAPCASPR